MSMSPSELKYSLRKTEFPYCCRDALARLEQLCVSSTPNRAPSTKHMELGMDIIDEFILCEVDRRGQKKRRMNSIQELQLLEVLCDYFLYPNSDVARNTIFMTLFPPGQGCSEYKMKILAKLVSMAISTKNAPVLISTGIWMQQLGCTSKYSLDLAQVLVKDYFVLVPKAVSRLQDLPQLAPQFTANFLTAVAEMYGGIEKKRGFSPPPDSLLEVITQWVSSNSQLCLAALLINMQPALPVGAITMSALTPFAGLLKWCAIAPLYYRKTQPTSEEEPLTRYKWDTTGKSCSTASEKCSESPLYSRLHLALLESLLECWNVSLRLSQQSVISLQHIACIAEDLLNYIPNISELEGEEARVAEATIQVALDRLGQAVQVSLITGFAYGNKQELFSQLSSLPPNRLVSIVIKKHR